MASRRVLFRVKAERGCPLFSAGDQMVLHLPGVDAGGSSAVCAFTIAKFLTDASGSGCPDTPSPVDRGTLQCPRRENPVVFEVESVIERHTPTPIMSAPTDDLPFTVSQLRRLHVFRALSASFLGQLAQKLSTERYATGSVILERGQVGRAFFVLLEGEVEVIGFAQGQFSGVVNSLKAPNCFGEMSLLTGSPTAARVVARSEVMVLVLEEDDFHRMLRDPAMAQRFTRLLAARVESANSHIVREGSLAFRGKLSVMSVSTVLQVLAEARRSGCLHLRSDEKSATVGYNDGRIYNASCGHQRGPAAVFKMLTWEHGDFWLDVEPIPQFDEVEIGVMGLLLEGMRRIDEGSVG